MPAMWSVGELARATGVTVRALHHYDEVGLLAPSARTAAGHRRYSDEDLRRLYDDRPNAHGMSPELMAYVHRAWEAGDF